MKPLISVIVPVYKVEAYLDECIQSIVKQTYNNLEIILVDDGSPDSCPQICDTWAKKDSRIKVIHQQNLGPSAARKTGLLSSSGEYLCFVDSDDYIAADLCEQTMGIFQQENVEIVVFDWEAFPTERKKQVPYTEKINEGVLSSKSALTELVISNINNYFWNKIYKRHVFDGIEFPNQKFWEDTCVMYNLFINAENIYCFPRKLYYYRMHNESIIHNITGKDLGDIFCVSKQRYTDLSVIYPEIAELAFLCIPIAALRFYDRSLWETVDSRLLNEAIDFLVTNKSRILGLEIKRRFIWFYRNRQLYNIARLFIHRVGNIVKKLKWS